MEMNYQAAQFYLNAMNIIATFALALYVYISNSKKATMELMKTQDQRLTSIESAMEQYHPKEVHDDLNGLKTRLAELNVSVRHLPDESDIGKVHARIDKLAESVSHIQGQLGQINVNLHLISEYLMKK